MALAGFAASLTGFPRQFWIINGIELLERLGYYGALSVTALYLAHIGYSDTEVGALMGLLLPVPYAVALFSGPLSEKFGYRPTILAAFVFYGAGYAVFALSTFATGRLVPIDLAVAQFTVPIVVVLLAGIVLVGVGAGTFKPLPAATVALTTTEERRNLGYTIYYWAINVGAFVGPFTLAFVFKAYAAGFLFAAAIMGANFAVTFLLFRNPNTPDPTTSLLAAVRRLGPGFRDTRFVVLLVIYAGFWFMYSMNFTLVPVFAARLVNLPSWFPPSLQQAINPAVIILFGIPIGKFVEKIPPLRMMTYGITLTVGGFVLMGFTRNFGFFAAGLAVATVGEVLTQPGFLSLVSRIAPKDRVAAYQGMGFLPIAVGFMVGPLVLGGVYENLVTEDGRPALFWAIVAGTGLVTIAAFALYMWWVSPRPEREAPTTVPTPPPLLGRKPAILYAMVAILLIPALIGAAALPKPIPAPPGPAQPINVAFELPPMVRYVEEGHDKTAKITLDLPTNLTGEIVIVLRWADNDTDDPAGTVNPTNDPDSFTLEVKDRASRSLAKNAGSNRVGEEGRLEVRYPATSDPGVRVFLTLQAGDYMFSGAKLRDDIGSWYTLEVRGERKEMQAAGG